jgi:hypothetical protein
MPKSIEDITPRPPVESSQPTIDGAFSDDGIDLTVIRWMLDLTPTERLRAVQDLIDAARALRAAAGDDP